MPFYKTKILNREISLEYEKKDEKKIIDSINLINEKIDNKLQNDKKILEDEKLKLDQEFDEINKKVEGLIDVIKNSYYE